MADFDLTDVQNYLAAKTQNPQAVTSASPDLAKVQQYLAQKQAAQASAPQPDPGKLESLGRGLEQGATLNFGPRINAGVQSLLDDSDYDQNLKNEQAKMDKAKAAHPYLYGAGNVAGFIAPTLATGGENLVGEGIAGAAKAGAAYGAAGAVGDSKDLTDLPQVAQNAVTGGVLGGIGGGAVGMAGQALSPITNQLKNMGSSVASTFKGIGPLPTASDAFQQGLQGNALWGEQPHVEATRSLIDKIKGAGSTIKDALAGAGSDQRAALNAENSNVDIGDWLNDVNNAALSGKKSTSFGENRDAIDKVLGVVDEFVNGSDGNPGRGTNVTPLQANELKRTLGQLGTEGNDAMPNPVGRQFANRIISPSKHAANEVESSFALPDSFTPLKDTINDAVDNLSPANQRINKLLLAQDMLPDINTLATSERATTAGASANDRLQEFFDTLPEDVRQQIQPNLESAAKTKAVADRINAGGLNRGALSLAETGRGTLWGASNLAGSAINGIKTSANQAANDYSKGDIGSLFKTMYNQSPETFNSVGQSLVNMGGTAGDIGKALVGASQKDGYGRNAIIFALSQNPAYRQEIEKHFGNGSGIDMNGPASSTSQLERTGP
jgi:hypothetical protein